MNKILLYLDTETTGLSHKKHDIVQIAAVAYYNNEWAGTINLSCQPFSYDTVNEHALKVCNLTVDDLKGFDSPMLAFKKFISALHKIRTRIDPSAKFTGIAHNAPFDKKMLARWWDMCADSIDADVPKMKNFFNETWIDSLILARELVEKNIVKSENSKLETLAEHFSITYEGRGAHDALSDTVVLQKVFTRLLDECQSAIDSGMKLHGKTFLEAVYG